LLPRPRQPLRRKLPQKLKSSALLLLQQQRLLQRQQQLRRRLPPLRPRRPRWQT